VVALDVLQCSDLGTHKGYPYIIFLPIVQGVNLKAGFTAAGMLAPFAELETAESEIFEYGKRSIELWDNLMKEVGVYDGFKQLGTIITAHPQDVTELDHFIGTLKSKVEEAKDIEQIDSQALAKLEPDLAQHQHSFYLKDEGHVDSQRFMAFSTNYFDAHLM
jgi:Glycine/D-amino acid oxidases (deaminating)